MKFVYKKSCHFRVLFQIVIEKFYI